MSYDLRIYTIQKQDLKDLLNQFNLEKRNDDFVLLLRNHQIVINSATPIQDEDIPPQISEALPGIKYVIECNLEPTTYEEKFIKELLKIGKVIAKNGIGVIENPQADEIILPSGIKRVQQIDKTERYSILELSWWFNHENVQKEENINLILKELKRNIPEALPRRYGLYEPPTEKFTTLASFQDYLMKNVKESVVWYPNKPVEAVQLGIPPFIGAMKKGYRFGYFSISIDSAVLSMPGWITVISRLFKSLSEVLCPFYGDIYLLKDYIRSRTGPCSDYITEHHPIVGWWWNGFPRELGLGIVIGNPIMKYVNIKRNCSILNNRCQMILGLENETNMKLSNNDIEISECLYQPKEHTNSLFGGHIKLYPELWLFDGPFSE